MSSNCFSLIFSSKEQQKPPLKRFKFCALRPKQVKLLGNMPHDVCTCVYHQNFIECCTVLNKNIAGFPAYGPELMLLLVCDISKACSFKTCKVCVMGMLRKSWSVCFKERRDQTWLGTSGPKMRKNIVFKNCHRKAPLRSC